LLAVCCLLASATFVLMGCGGNTSAHDPGSAGVSSPSNPGPPDGDGDVDRYGQGRYDIDSDANPTFGPYATPAERQAVAAFIKRYYAIAATGNGAKACALLDPLVAEMVAQGRNVGWGPSSLKGGTCPRVATEFFAQRRRELFEDVATLRVGWVQLQAKQAIALVHFGSKRERIVRLRRRYGVWQMFSLLDDGPL
jgi:hypothetical protein